MADRIKGITIEIGGDTTGLSAALSGVNKQISATQKELRDVERLLKLDPKNTELVAQKQRALANEIAAVREKLQGLKDAEKQVQEQFQQGKISQEQYDALRREIIATENQLKSLETEARKLDPGTLEHAAAVTKEWGAALENVASKAQAVAEKTRLISGAAAAALGGSALLASNYEDALAKVSTIADESAVSMEDMAEAITALSNETGIASADLADAVYNAISAGQDTADAVSFVERATTLARAGFTDTASALDVLTTIMNAYKLEAGEVANVSDLLIATQNYGKTTVAELSAAIGKVIPTAAAYGVELDQLAASYAIVTANGVATREATTYLNALLNELGKSGTKVSEILAEKTGKSFAELSAEGVTLGEALEVIRDAATEQGLAFNDMFSSSEAAKAGLILLGDSAAEFNTMLGKVRSSTGATETAFGKLDTTSYRVQKTINQAKNTVIELGRTVLELAAPALDNLAEIVENVRGAVGKMDDATKRQIVSAVAAVAAISPLAGTIAKVTQAAAGLANGVSFLLANPIVAAIVAATAAAAALAIAIHNANEASRERVENTAAYLAAYSDYTQAEREYLDAIDANTERLASNRAATEEAAASIAFQRERALELVEALKSITDENGNVSETNSAQARIIIDELNAAYGLELELIDGQIKGYETLVQSVYDVIDAKTAEALLERHQADYLDALEAQAGLLQAIRTAHNNATEAQEEYTRATQTAEAALAYYQAHQLEMTASEMQAYDERLASLTEWAEQASAAYEQSMADEASYSQQYLENSRLIQNYDAAQLAAYRGNTQEVLDLMTGRANAWHDYGDTVDAVTAAALDDMYDEVITAAEYAAEVRRNWQDGVEGYTADMVDEADAAFNNVLGAFNNMYNEATGIGSDFASGVSAGLESQRAALEAKARSIAGVIPHGFRDPLGIHSPSTVGAWIGRMWDEGLIQGQEQLAADVVAASQEMAQGMRDAFDGDAHAGEADLVAQTAGFFSAPAAIPSVGGNTTTNNSNTYGAVNITINGAPGQDVRQLADIIMEEIQQAVDRREAVYA